MPCVQTALSPQVTAKLYAHVLGEGSGGSPRFPCYLALEQAVTSPKGVNEPLRKRRDLQVRKKSQMCGAGQKGPKFDDMCRVLELETTPGNLQAVQVALQGLRDHIKMNRSIAAILRVIGWTGDDGGDAGAREQPARTGANQTSAGSTTGELARVAEHSTGNLRADGDPPAGEGVSAAAHAAGSDGRIAIPAQTLEVEVAEGCSVHVPLDTPGVKVLKEIMPAVWNEHRSEIIDGSPSLRSGMGVEKRRMSTYERETYKQHGKSVAFDFRVTKDDVFLDVGGHIGLASVDALLKGAARAIIVEPIPANLALLRRNLAQFGDRVTIVEKCVVPTGAADTARMQSNGWRSRVVESGGDCDAATVTMQALIDQYRPSIIKIDIEGAEEDVLKQDIDWGVCERLCFEYTVTSESATELQAALQAARWDTKSWLPSVFQTGVNHGAGIDRVLFCTREVPSIYDRLHAELQGMTIPTTDRQQGCRGMTLGLKARSGAAIAQPTHDHPKLVKLVAELGEQLPRDFLFSTAYVTQNSQFDPHCDGSNAGDSAIACVGDYTGGELYVAGCTIDMEPAAAQVLNARGSLQFFDGNRCHATLPFEGTRYSVIYYCQKAAYEPGPTSSARGVTAEMRAELNELGFRKDRGLWN